MTSLKETSQEIVKKNGKVYRVLTNKEYYEIVEEKIDEELADFETRKAAQKKELEDIKKKFNK